MRENENRSDAAWSLVTCLLGLVARRAHRQRPIDGHQVKYNDGGLRTRVCKTADVK